MAEKELGERNFGFDSEVQIETLHGGERDCCRMRDSCQFTADVPTSRSYADSSGWTAPAAPPPEESAYLGWNNGSLEK